MCRLVLNTFDCGDPGVGGGRVEEEQQTAGAAFGKNVDAVVAQEIAGGVVACRLHAFQNGVADRWRQVGVGVGGGGHTGGRCAGHGIGDDGGSAECRVDVAQRQEEHSVASTEYSDRVNQNALAGVRRIEERQAQVDVADGTLLLARAIHKALSGGDVGAYLVRACYRCGRACRDQQVAVLIEKHVGVP